MAKGVDRAAVLQHVLEESGPPGGRVGRHPRQLDIVAGYHVARERSRGGVRDDHPMGKWKRQIKVPGQEQELSLTGPHHRVRVGPRSRRVAHCNLAIQAAEERGCICERQRQSEHAHHNSS